MNFQGINFQTKLIGMNKNKNNNLMTACIHVLKGKSVYHRTEGTVICEKCFKHYNGYGHDKNGHWKIPKNEDLTNLKSVCRECVNKILKNRKTNYDF